MTFKSVDRYGDHKSRGLLDASSWFSLLSSDLGWTELEQKGTFPALAPGEELQTGDELPLQGGGFTKAIYLKRFAILSHQLLLGPSLSEFNNYRFAT